uniref:PH domain-containing protein n=1 Tax=Chromera velia CCMP2878 TaxID=1169474 RepID=A0A0G4I256_9ALVE|eukprot:Cvel_10251.t1-p1 / transcript=Cvel_10251.t1 / gene=Cvel_10251 / organism=Chromera_velia_CCMP2878 / gene_product=hypothetical protein / transcript_product=hypothetical protein / location=Cvel_scaffold614:42315-49343(-) / protein_length=491 / sequence_SO=supercontig / SO=protein_coding / is_pseudo=false
MTTQLNEEVLWALAQSKGRPAKAEGLVWRQESTGNTKGFRQKHCVLKANFLFQFEQKEDTTPSACLCLEEAKVTRLFDSFPFDGLPPGKRWFCISISFSSVLIPQHAREHVLALEGERHYREWAGALEEASTAALHHQLSESEDRYAAAMRECKRLTRLLSEAKAETVKSEAKAEKEKDALREQYEALEKTHEEACAARDAYRQARTEIRKQRTYIERLKQDVIRTENEVAEAEEDLRLELAFVEADEMSYEEEVTQRKRIDRLRQQVLVHRAAAMSHSLTVRGAVLEQHIREVTDGECDRELILMAKNLLQRHSHALSLIPTSDIDPYPGSAAKLDQWGRIPAETDPEYLIPAHQERAGWSVRYAQRQIPDVPPESTGDDDDSDEILAVRSAALMERALKKQPERRVLHSTHEETSRSREKLVKKVKAMNLEVDESLRSYSKAQKELLSLRAHVTKIQQRIHEHNAICPAALNPQDTSDRLEDWLDPVGL